MPLLLALSLNPHTHLLYIIVLLFESLTLEVCKSILSPEPKIIEHFFFRIIFTHIIKTIGQFSLSKWMPLWWLQTLGNYTLQYRYISEVKYNYDYRRGPLMYFLISVLDHNYPILLKEHDKIFYFPFSELLMCVQNLETTRVWLHKQALRDCRTYEILFTVMSNLINYS